MKLHIRNTIVPIFIRIKWILSGRMIRIHSIQKKLKNHIDLTPEEMHLLAEAHTRQLI